MRIITAAGGICVMTVGAFCQSSAGAPAVDIDKLTTACIQNILTNTMADISRRLQDEVAASVERRVEARVQEKLERMQERVAARIEKRTARLEHAETDR